MITDISGDVVERVLAVLVEQSRFASLHHDIPDFATPSISELQFGGYTRIPVQWDTHHGSGFASNTARLLWSGLVFPSRVVAVGLHLEQFGGAVTAYGALTQPSSITSDSWYLDAGKLVLRLATGLQ